MAIECGAKNLYKAYGVPSLDLTFADKKSLVDRISGNNLITFTRASTATYVGFDGLIKTAAVNEPRFDHNPTTGESLGLLVEEARTNLLLRSEEVDTTWTLTGLLAFGSGSTVDAIASPNGQITADLLTESTTTGAHQIAQGINVTTGAVYTLSVFAKAASSPRRLTLLVNNTNFGSTPSAVFDLSAGTNISVGSGTATITPFINGWYRVTLTTIAATGTGPNALSFRLTDNTNATSYTGDGTSGIYLWGAQLESGSFPTSYIPTTTAGVTRAADVASITGAAFSSWYRQDEGTMFIDGVLRGILTQNYFVSISAGFSGADAHVIFGVSGALRYAVAVSSASQVNIALGSASVDDQQFIAASYQQNNFAAARNGVLGASDTLGNLPTVDTLKIGTNFSNGAVFSGHIRRFTYWPTRLSNSTLQALTQ